MPQLIPGNEVTAYLAIINAAPYPGGPSEVQRITESNLLVYYSDVATVIYRQVELFQANNAYLIAAITCFNDTQLQAVGIFVNKVQTSPPVNDPIMIINSNYDNVILNPNVSSPPMEKTLSIFGTSKIGLISLAAGTVVDELRIGPGAHVDGADSSAGATSPPASPPNFTAIDTLWMPFARSKPSKLNYITLGSRINNLVVDEGSYFGGMKEDPDVPCADAVTGMQATEVTKNGILVSWTPPAQYLFINTFYRKTNSMVWILATEVDGDFVNDTGFIFRSLESDTWYDFKASVVCSNGGIAKTEITTKTICCGAGTQLSIYKFCQITALITASPASPPASQVLCNGVTINLQYPPGPTLTIPYLASVNAAIVTDFVLDNIPYQLMPYNAATATWDVSSTPIGTLIDGNVVTVGVSIPA